MLEMSLLRVLEISLLGVGTVFCLESDECFSGPVA